MSRLYRVHVTTPTESRNYVVSAQYKADAINRVSDRVPDAITIDARMWRGEYPDMMLTGRNPIND